jgi:apolipoprotein N-acyltransferase
MLSFRELPPKYTYLIALLAGLSMVLAFAPFAWRFMAWLAPAVFFWLNLQPMSRAQRVKLAWVFGIGLFAGGAHWIYFSIHYFGGANNFIAVLMVSLFVVLMGLFLMLFGWLASFFNHYSTVLRLLIVFPAIWTLTEWFRGWFLTGFPWLWLGNTQIDNGLAHYAPITGVLGVSWVVAVGAGALVLFVIGSNRERILATVSALVLVALGFGLSTIQWTQPIGERIFVSMLQGNVDQFTKWDPDFRNENIQAYMDLMDPDKYPNVETSHLVIWPETALSDFFQRSVDDVMLPMQEWSKEAKTDILMGGFFYDKDKEAVYNAVMAIGEGHDVEKSLETQASVTAKQHLVPFSEYIPFLEQLRFLENIIKLPYDNVTPWSGSHIVTVAKQPMAVSVCYEDAYANEIIKSLPEATMLVNVSNDGWFTGSIEPQQHAEIARMRSLETGRYMLRATNNGVTAVINSQGQVMSSLPQYTAGVLSDYAQPMQGTTPYVRVGNWLIIAMMSLLLMIPLILTRLGKKLH